MQSERKLAAAQDQPVDAMIPPDIRHDRQPRAFGLFEKDPADPLGCLFL
jgi:hypothetical protein